MEEGKIFSALQEPYRKLDQVADLQENNFYLDVYISHYKNRYRNEPIFDLSNIHFKYIKDLRKLVGNKTGEVLEHYFEMKDDWFYKQQHSLECLIKNINAVVNSLSSRARPSFGNSKMMNVDFHCDACWKAFVLTCPLNYDFNTFTRCEQCEKEDRPLKTVTKEERRKAILKYGEKFIDMPKSTIEEEFLF